MCLSHICRHHSCGFCPNSSFFVKLGAALVIIGTISVIALAVLIAPHVTVVTALTITAYLGGVSGGLSMIIGLIMMCIQRPPQTARNPENRPRTLQIPPQEVPNRLQEEETAPSRNIEENERKRQSEYEQIQRDLQRSVEDLERLKQVHKAHREKMAAKAAFFQEQLRAHCNRNLSIRLTNQ